MRPLQRKEDGKRVESGRNGGGKSVERGREGDGKGTERGQKGGGTGTERGREGLWRMGEGGGLFMMELWAGMVNFDV